jgi:hypothetical protein
VDVPAVARAIPAAAAETATPVCAEAAAPEAVWAVPGFGAAPASGVGASPMVVLASPAASPPGAPAAPGSAPGNPGTMANAAAGPAADPWAPGAADGKPGSVLPVSCWLIAAGAPAITPAAVGPTAGAAAAVDPAASAAAAGEPGTGTAGTVGAAGPDVEVSPTAPADANADAGVAAPPATADTVVGGERLPGAGNCPPTVPASAAVCPAALRAGLAPALLRADAKSWLLAPDLSELTDATVPCCAGSDGSWICDTEGVAFISPGIASHVPTTNRYFRYLSNQSNVRRIASAL